MFVLNFKNIVNSLLNESIEESNEDFGVNVKGDLTIEDIKKGTPVFHRPKDSDGDDPLKVIKSLMEHGFSREYTGDNGGNMYGPGVYNVYSLRSSNDRARGYGHYIVQSYVLGGFKNFLIFNIDMAKEIYGNNWHIAKQVEMLMPPKLAYSIIKRFNLWAKDDNGHSIYMNTNATSYHKKTSSIAVQITDALGENIKKTKIRGIIYSGGHDGNCCFVRNFLDVIPYSYSTDNGKTWTVGITENLIWKAGHSTDVEANLKYRTDDNGRRMFSDVSDKSINGYVIVYDNNKANYFEVATNQLISDVWFDFASNFENGEAEVIYNGKKYKISKYEDGNYIVNDMDGFPICYLNDLPNQEQ